MKELSLNIKWLKSLSELRESYTKDEILIQRVKPGQKVFIEKQGESVKILSASGYDLSKRFAPACKQLINLSDDFTLIGTYNDALFIHDIVKLNGVNLARENFEKRYDKLSTLQRDGAFEVTESHECESFRNLWDFDDDDQGALIKAKTSLLEGPEDNIWYYYPRYQDLRQVIISDFYLGNRVGNEREVIFKCQQHRHGKSVFVGKLRVDNPAIRKKLMRLSQRKKRAVALVHVRFDIRNKNKFSKLYFHSLVFDEKFKDIVVDDERYFKPLIIVNVRSQKKSVVITKTLCKNLNMVSGVI